MKKNQTLREKKNRPPNLLLSRLSPGFDFTLCNLFCFAPLHGQSPLKPKNIKICFRRCSLAKMSFVDIFSLSLLDEMIKIIQSNNNSHLHL